MRADFDHHEDHGPDQAIRITTASEPLTDATIAAIATPTMVPAIRANDRFTVVATPNWLTTSTVSTSQAPSDPGHQINAARVTPRQHGDRDRVHHGVHSGPRFWAVRRDLPLPQQRRETNAPHSPPPPKNNMFHNRYEVLVRSTAVSPLHSGGAMIMNAR